MTEFKELHKERKVRKNLANIKYVRLRADINLSAFFNRRM
jgi:hypothetical protein